MIDPRLAWFVMGATCSAVVFGWPWHPRFSRFSHENTAPDSSEARPRKFRDIHRNDHRLDILSLQRPLVRSITFPDPSPDRQPTNPFTGNPAKPQPHGGRIIRDGQWDPSWNCIDMRTGYQPRPHSGIPNPPPSDP